MKVDRSRKLNSSYIFQGISDDECFLLESQLQRESYRSDEIILTQGQEGRGLFFIVSGTLSVTARLFGDRQIELAQLNTGDVFGEISLFSHLIVTASIKAITDTEVIFLNRKRFGYLWFTYPKIVKKICHNTMESVCGRMRDSKSANFTLFGGESPEKKMLSQNKVETKGKPLSLEIISSTIQNFNDLAMDLNEQIALLENEAFCRSLKCFYFNRKQIVFLENERFDGYMYLIAKGAVQISVSNSFQVDRKVQVNGPGSFIGVMPYFDHQRRYGSAFCREDTILFGIRKQTVDRLFESNVKMFNRLNALLCESICSMFYQKNKLILRTRAYNLLYQIGKDRACAE